MFDQAEKIIETIAKDCPETGAELTDALDGLRNVSCNADIEKKPDAFTLAAEAIKTGREVCPNHEKDFDALDTLLVDAGTVKCSG